MGWADPLRVSEIFLAASRRPADVRADFLTQACKGDPELRAAVDLLLFHDGNMAEMSEPPAAAQLAPAPAPLPDRIGPYRVVEQIGEGGMGIVYRALQVEPIRREVAVKLIKPGIETREVLARFESERQALALMNHPNIARVFDAGVTEQGRPYFAMEYVAGEPITDYCDARNARVRARLELFLQVCDGVQHAHHKAVIHRDLKPSNVLVTVEGGKPVPKIIDFGVARATERRVSDVTLSTDFGQFLGTPEYMSPEQTEQDGRAVDTRTDVYSLGVLLYELLVGARPFELTSINLEAIRRTIREDEAPRPSARVREQGDTAARLRGRSAESLARRLRGELDWIVTKALEKDPARRYDSPAEFAADIRRHLDDDPVSAGPPSRVYRAGKFLRRHRRVVALASAMVLMLIVSIATVTLLAARLAHERDRATREVAASEQVLDFVVGLFDEADPAARQMLDGGVQRIHHDYAGQPLAQARLMVRMAEAYRRLDLPERSSELLDDALIRMRAALGEEAAETLEVKHALGVARIGGFRLDESARLLEEVVRVRRLRRGRWHPATLRAQTDLARTYQLKGRLDAAELLLREAIDGLRRSLGAADPATRHAETYLGSVLLDCGRYDEAKILMLQVLDTRPADAARYDSDSLICLYNLACVEAASGAPDEALRRLREAVDWGFLYGHRHADGTLDFGPDGMLHDVHLMSLHGDPRFEAIVGEQGYLRALITARWNSGYGTREDALKGLEEAVRRGYANRAFLVADRRLIPLRGEPRFAALLARLE